MSRMISHVLCVDDDPDILEIVQLSLETVGGLRVSSVKGGDECLRKAAALRPDLILLDVMMPGMDGATTLQALKADPGLATIPVVFMSARVQPAEVAGYLALGAAGVIPKPFDPMTLADEISTIFAARDA